MYEKSGHSGYTMNRIQTNIPDDILEIVGNDRYTLSSIGMSSSEVRIYGNYVLKIQPHNEETDNEFLMTRWLCGRIPIPEILTYRVVKDTAFTLMTRMDGKMLCDSAFLENPETLIRIAADGLKKLWEIRVDDCPYSTSRLTSRLKAAEYNVKNGLVDMDNVDPETFGEGGFADPSELLSWLKDNRPEEDIVLTHGDYCLPNIFARNSKLCGFIDLGKLGPADRWQDIAIAVRSIRDNLEGRYSIGKKVSGFTPQMLLDELSVEFNAEKYRYYILLDELF